MKKRKYKIVIEKRLKSHETLRVSPPDRCEFCDRIEDGDMLSIHPIGKWICLKCENDYSNIGLTTRKMR